MCKFHIFRKFEWCYNQFWFILTFKGINVCNFDFDFFYQGFMGKTLHLFKEFGEKSIFCSLYQQPVGTKIPKRVFNIDYFRCSNYYFPVTPNLIVSIEFLIRLCSLVEANWKKLSPSLILDRILDSLFIPNVLKMLIQLDFNNHVSLDLETCLFHQEFNPKKLTVSVCGTLN